MDRPLLGTRLATDERRPRQHGDVRLASGPGNRHAFQPVQRNQSASAVRKYPGRKGITQCRQPDGTLTHAQRNLWRRRMGRNVQRLQTVGRLGICLRRKLHEPAPGAHDTDRGAQIRLSARLHLSFPLVVELPRAERLLRTPLVSHEQRHPEERYPGTGTQLDTVELLRPCRKFPETDGDRDRIPGVCNDFGKESGGI